MVVFSQASLRLCNLEAHVSVCYDKEDSLLTCMGMVEHWQKMITCKSPIDITSLVTHIAQYVGVLENAQVTYLPMTDEY